MSIHLYTCDVIVSQSVAEVHHFPHTKSSCKDFTCWLDKISEQRRNIVVKLIVNFVPCFHCVVHRSSNEKPETIKLLL